MYTRLLLVGLSNFKNWLGTRKKVLQPYMGGNFVPGTYHRIYMYIASLLNHIQNSESLNTIIYISVIVTVQFFVA